MPSLGPDDFLYADQFDEINRRFYAAEPADYFGMRVQLLLLALGRSDEVSALLADGVEWRSLSFRTGDTAFPEPDDDEARRRLDAAGVADAEVIYHHAAECLLRLVLAHVGAPPCPQLEIARTRSPGEFKRRVRADLLERTYAEVREDVWPLFYGSDRLLELLDPRPTDGEFEAAKDAAVKWVQHYATTWLDRAAVYNTAKHGFALNAGDGGFSLGPMGPDDFVLERTGPVISYMDLVGEKGDRKWAEHMVFVEPEETLGYTFNAADMIRQLWLLARNYYVREPSPGKVLFFQDHLAQLDTARAQRLGPFQLQGLVMPLLYLSERSEPAAGA